MMSSEQDDKTSHPWSVYIVQMIQYKTWTWKKRDNVRDMNQIDGVLLIFMLTQCFRQQLILNYMPKSLCSMPCVLTSELRVSGESNLYSGLAAWCRRLRISQDGWNKNFKQESTQLTAVSTEKSQLNKPPRPHLTFSIHRQHEWEKTISVLKLLRFCSLGLMSTKLCWRTAAA